MLQVGIVGLPNVGKSTLFNALLKRQPAFAEASAGQAGSSGARVGNYPFTTIEPNVGVVPVPDNRLEKLADSIASLQNDGVRPPIVPATVRFVDIAGLVKGASTGAGLGNKFLAYIRETDLICQVVRAFPDENIIREGSTTPKDDITVVNTELILADMQTIQNYELRMKNYGDGTRKLHAGLDRGKLAREIELTDEERETTRELQLLTDKEIIYVLNINTKGDWEAANKLADQYPGQVCVIDAKLEADLGEFSVLERNEYLLSLGIKKAGVDELIKLAYQRLGLISYLTAPDSAKASSSKGWEVRAWTIRSGTEAPQAAGVIHTDFEKGFIKAEAVNFSDFVSFGGWKKCRELGRVRLEGKDYIVKDGDVIEFKVGPA